MRTQGAYPSPATDADAARLLRKTSAKEQAFARLVRCGPSALSIAELLQVLMNSKSEPLLSLRLLNQWGSLSKLAHASPAEPTLCEIVNR